MISMQILGLKAFMNKLLLSATFDRFLVSEASVTTFAAFHIDGRLQKNFYSKEEQEERGMENQSLLYWEQLRPYCLELMKGKRTPLSFRIVLQLSPANLERLLAQSGLPYQPSDVNGLFLNLRYDGAALTCVTGVSMALFTLDKSLEREWDQLVQRFFLKQELPFELLT